jgi:hypothetical protein
MKLFVTWHVSCRQIDFLHLRYPSILQVSQSLIFVEQLGPFSKLWKLQLVVWQQMRATNSQLIEKSLLIQIHLVQI